MTITPSTLTRGAAIGTAVAGVLFILIQPLHPDEDLASVTTSTWAIVHGMSLTMAILGLAGITAVYLRQVSKFGVLGLVAYLLFALFFIMQAVFVFAEIFIAPLTAAGSPDFTEDFIKLFASGEAPTTDLGLLVAAVPIGGAAYLLGGTLFGVAIIRAGILARWSGILLIVGSVASLAAAVVPHDQARLAAIPMGLALAGLGYAVWSEQRATDSDSDTLRREHLFPDSEPTQKEKMKSLLNDKTVLRALILTELMILVTSVHHIYRLGLELLIPAGALFTLTLLLMWWHSRGRDRLSSWVYAGYVGTVFFYFGIVDGFLDHVVKAVGLNNTTFLPGSDAEVIETVYHLWSPEAGSVFYEATGIMTFVSGLAAMFFTVKFVRQTATRSARTRNGVAEARA